MTKVCSQVQKKKNSVDKKFTVMTNDVLGIHPSGNVILMVFVLLPSKLENAYVRLQIATPPRPEK